MKLDSPRRRLLLVPLTLLIGGAILVGLRSPRVESRGDPAAETPADCIARLLAAEDRGDEAAYRDCFAATSRRSREPKRRMTPPPVRSDPDLLGRAMTNPVFEGPDRARLDLERIRRDHTEIQQVILVRERGRWRIEWISAPERRVPAIPYGTPVSPE